MLVLVVISMEASSDMGLSALDHEILFDLNILVVCNGLEIEFGEWLWLGGNTNNGIEFGFSDLFQGG